MSDEKVTDLADFRQKKTDLVFECKCGSQLFYLRYAEPGLVGTIECRLCEQIMLGKCWGSRDDAPSANT